MHEGTPKKRLKQSLLALKRKLGYVGLKTLCVALRGVERQLHCTRGLNSSSKAFMFSKTDVRKFDKATRFNNG